MCYPANDFREQHGKLQEKADESARFLVVDPNTVRNAIAKDWGWITTTGALTMLLGLAAFGLPLAATEVAYTGTTLTVGAAGIVGLLNIFFAQTGQHKVTRIFGCG